MFIVPLPGQAHYRQHPRWSAAGTPDNFTIVEGRCHGVEAWPVDA